jgi:hypothetical protein
MSEHKGDKCVNLGILLNNKSFVAFAPQSPGHAYQLGVRFGSRPEAEHFQQETSRLAMEPGAKPFNIEPHGTDHVVMVSSQYVAVTHRGENKFELLLNPAGYHPANGAPLPGEHSQLRRIRCTVCVPNVHSNSAAASSSAGKAPQSRVLPPDREGVKGSRVQFPPGFHR